LTTFKLGENYPRTEHNTLHMFNIITPNIEFAITPPRITRFCSNFVKSLTTT